MLTLSLFISAFALAALSGLPGLLNPHRGGRLQPYFLGAATLLGMAYAGLVLTGRASGPLEAPWALPNAALVLNFDPISAWFVVPVLLVATALAHYGNAYWSDEEHPDNAPLLRVLFGLTVAALTLLSVAYNLILFLMAWEAMAILGFLMITVDHRSDEVRKAGWIYLGAAHLGNLALFAAFALLAASLNSYTLHELPLDFATSSRGTAVFVLLLIGFGMKAGLAPLHLWLPVAHPAAPSHVSAFLSGVMIKAGILGFLRILALLPNPPLTWGAILTAIGAVSAVLGIAHANGQRDVKRLLAFSSIENIGIVVMGLGIALVGRALGRTDVFALGLGGALLHIWNHSLFKSMLFLAAGAVAHGAGTRDMEQLGGLAKRMPFTAGIFVLGGAAICGLPPLNGFVSEWLIYVAAFRAIGPAGWAWAVLVVVALALAGGLAVAAFTKLIGTVFLGEPRSVAAERADEAEPAMRTAMGALAAFCILLGLVPIAVSPLLDRVVRSFAPNLAPEPLHHLAGLGSISLVALVLLGIAFLAWFLIRRLKSTSSVTWDCGYVAPTVRMQYTGTSYSAILKETFRWMLRPWESRPRIRGLFPKGTQYEDRVPEPVLERAVMPIAGGIAWVASSLRALQGGHLFVYLIYMVLTLIALLAWTLA